MAGATRREPFANGGSSLPVGRLLTMGDLIRFEAAYLAASCQVAAVCGLMAISEKWISRLEPGGETKSIFGRR